MLHRPLLAAAMAASCVGSAQAALVVSKGATSNVTCSSGVCVATAADAVLNVKQLKQLLKTASVVVASGGAAKDIVFAGELSWAKPSRLTLDSWRGIVVTKPVTSQGTGGVTLTTNDGGTGGDYSFEGQGRIAFWDLSSALIINGVSYTLANSVASLASAVAANPQGALALANNYDASADGTYSLAPVETELQGTFEGLGHVVANLTIVKNWHSYGGLFASIAAQGTVRDIRLSNVNISDTTKPGGRVSRATQPCVGGLAGRSLGAIANAAVSGTVRGGRSMIGGLAGCNQGTILRSHSAAAVLGSGVQSTAGGLVGVQEGQVSLSSATGTVTGEFESTAGGLAGDNRGTIDQSFASGEVFGGRGQDTEGEPRLAFAGGLVGANGQVTRSYSTGTVHYGLTSYSGGLAGSYSIVSQSYTAGVLVAEDHAPCITCIGGFSGRYVYNPADDYWDVDTSGLNQGTGDGNVPGVTGLGDAELKSALPAGFDPAIWGQSAGINDGYPYLLANPPQ